MTMEEGFRTHCVLHIRHRAASAGVSQEGTDLESTTALPSGTVTFLFTDIEGSIRLWEQHPDTMGVALARHDALLRDAIQSHGGVVFKTIGDAFCAAFSSVPEAFQAALAAQRALQEQVAEGEVALRARMALHTGIAEERDGDYFGPALNRVARLLSAGHGGQLLLSQAAAAALEGSLPVGAVLHDLGAHRLKDLSQPEGIFRLAHPDLPVVDAPLRSLQAFSHNLPVQMTRFVGRESEMAAVRQLLTAPTDPSRLVTLTGAGGTGKSRLALQVAADLLDTFEDGVWLVELAPLADPALVPQTVATVLGLKEEPGRPLAHTLADHLRPKRVLLLLDNCEHLLAACAALAEAILGSCPGAAILATSREGLNIPGETTWPVPSLSLPDRAQLPSMEELAQFEAIQLFLDQATAVLPSFRLTPQNAPAVAQVCCRLDGIALAIQLAAARVKVLSVEQIAARLDDRFHLLTGGSRTALPRQQTLRALIDWSYDLLSEPERALLRRLSVFAGGWTLEAAEAVCAGESVERSALSIENNASASTLNAQGSTLLLGEWQVLDLLTSLVDKSLVVVAEEEGGARYHLLETVRQYGRDRLLEAREIEMVRSRHAGWFAEWAGERPTVPEDFARWHYTLAAEHDNLRASLEWSLSETSHGDRGLSLAVTLSPFWFRRGYLREGREWYQRLLAASPGAPLALRKEALWTSGRMAYFQGDFAAAQPCGEAALTLARELQDENAVALSLVFLGFTLAQQGEYPRARALFEESLTLLDRLGIRSGRARALEGLGNLAYAQGDYDSAEALLAEALLLAREADIEDLGFFVWSFGNVRRAQLDYAAARALYREALIWSVKTDLMMPVPFLVEGFGELAMAEGQITRAARLFGAAAAARQKIGSVPLPLWKREYEQALAAVEEVLGEPAFRSAWAEGRAMSLDQAIHCALEETSST
jgi:predicted ATPase/class 3 adenylate cyclase